MLPFPWWAQGCTPVNSVLFQAAERLASPRVPPPLMQRAGEGAPRECPRSCATDPRDLPPSSLESFEEKTQGMCPFLHCPPPGGAGSLVWHHLFGWTAPSCPVVTVITVCLPPPPQGCFRGHLLSLPSASPPSASQVSSSTRHPLLPGLGTGKSCVVYCAGLPAQRQQDPEAHGPAFVSRWK